MKNGNKYRRGVGIMLLNQEGNVFVGQRLDSQVEAWQMPQGGIDEGEEPHEAMARELMEEIGTDKFEIIHQDSSWLYYDLPSGLQKKLWDGQYLGQMQIWFLLRFIGTDSDINIHTAEPEFRNWKWVSPEDMEELIVDFKKDLYSQILQRFSKHLNF